METLTENFNRKTITWGNLWLFIIEHLVQIIIAII